MRIGNFGAAGWSERVYAPRWTCSGCGETYRDPQRLYGHLSGLRPAFHGDAYLWWWASAYSGRV